MLSDAESFGFEDWVAQGCKLDHNGSPPLYIKQYKLLKVANEYKVTVAVETGTSHGYTTSVLARHIEQVYTVEAHQPSFDVAKASLAIYPNVHMHFGNSAAALPGILKLCDDQRVLIWLDAHYSGPGTARLGKNTPVLDELEVIALRKNKHFVVLIDDARLFNGVDGYPTVAGIEAFRQDYLPFHRPAFVEHDQIHLLPENP